MYRRSNGPHKVSLDALSPLADAVVDEEAYLPSLDPETRRAVVADLDTLAAGDVDPYDCFGLVLVMLGVRPACSVSTMQPALSLSHAERVAHAHDALVTCGLLGQFLESYEIPYVLRTGYHEGRPDGPAQVFVNYYVSFDEARLSEYETRLLAAPTGTGAAEQGFSEHAQELGPGLPRSEEEALGRLLGYPEPAIRAYCEGDHLSGRQLLDTLSDAELAAALGPVAKLYDQLGLDHREFTRLALPYVVPETVPECLDRVVADATHYLVAGLVATEYYGMGLFSTVLAEYYDRVGRDGADPVS